MAGFYRKGRLEGGTTTGWRLKGIQLLANGWSKITKDYKINGIPRFMVFDKKGNIVSADAPRPSNPELKKMLEAELNR